MPAVIPFLRRCAFAGWALGTWLWAGAVGAQTIEPANDLPAPAGASEAGAPPADSPPGEPPSVSPAEADAPTPSAPLEPSPPTETPALASAAATPEQPEDFPRTPTTLPPRRAPPPAAPAPHRFVFAYGGARPLTWPTSYRRFGIADGVLTLAGASAAITAGVIGPNASGPSGGIWFDDDVRNALRPETYQSRLLAADLSDVFIGFAISYGLMLDPLVNAGWLRKSKDVGRQIFALNLEVLALTLGVQQAFANGIGRERPYGQVCGSDDLDGRTFDCTGDDRFRSHFSGHAAVSFSMAAATCTHHSFLHLSAKPPIAICALGFSNAFATAFLRIVADKHYVTDTLVGAAVGSLIGWVVPYFHYKTGKKPGQLALGDVELSLLPWAGGATLMGVMP